MIKDRRGTELEEVKRISENVSALIDSERAAEGANGMLFTLVKHIKPNVPQTTVSLLATTPKPRLVKLVILPLGEESLSSGSTKHKAMRGCHPLAGRQFTRAPHSRAMRPTALPRSALPRCGS